MRFNDMIATVLAASAERPEAREAQWRQLVDLLAQRQPGAPDAGARGGVRLPARRADARWSRAPAPPWPSSLAGLAIDPDLLIFFAEDRAEVAAPLLRSVRLGADDWLRVLPRLGPTARALLRHRRDLPREARRALAALGPADLVLGPQDEPAAAPPADGEPRPEAGSPILELVERIEAYQRRQREPAPQDTQPEIEAAQPAPAAFRWETGAEGVIRWVEGAPREPLVGLSIAAPADAGRPGLDAAEGRTPSPAAPRFATRRSASPERSMRRATGGLPVCRSSTRARGAFLGYRGAARRGGRRQPRAAGAFGPACRPMRCAS